MFRSRAWGCCAAVLFTTACAGTLPDAGTEDGPCGPGETCEPPLTCSAGFCVRPGSDGGGHGGGQSPDDEGGLAADGASDAGTTPDGSTFDAATAADAGPDGGPRIPRDDGGGGDGGPDAGGLGSDGGARSDAGPDAGDPPDGGLPPDAGLPIAGQWIGGPCTSVASCDYVDAICQRDGWPDGHCSLPCTQFCPDRPAYPVTFCIENDQAQGRCVSRCAAHGDCRPGYRCETRGRFNYPTVLQSVCVPAGSADGGTDNPYPDRLAAVRQAIESAQLAQVFAADAVTVPAGAKIIAVRIGAQGDQYFDYGGTAFDDAFWPASTIKLHAALAAVERVEQLGHTVLTTITYQAGYSGPFRALLDDALILSDNTAYDLLVTFVGFDEINSIFLVPERGFERTVIMRRYGSVGSLRDSPVITLIEGDRTTTLPSRHGSGTYPCPREGNCTNVFELADAIRRVGMHERLSGGERFRLSAPALAYLRYSLASNPGTRIYAGATDVLGSNNVLFYHKAGLAGGWTLDNGFIRDRSTGEEWVIALALPDSAPTFREITASILRAFRAGRLSATTVPR